MDDSIKDSAEREKAIRLVDYLTRIALLRSKVVRNVDDYQSVLWLNDVPRQKGCFTQAWGRDENHDADIWIEIQRPNEPELPTVPDLCQDWVKIESLRNTSDLPEISLEITVFIDNPDWSEDSDRPKLIAHTKRLEDYPDVQKAWDSYVESKWLDWAADYKEWESIHKVYSHLFEIDREQKRLGEEYELVLSLGLLIWRSPSGQNIRRHLLVADAMLEFETKMRKFTVRPHAEGAKLRPELDMLDAEECPPNAETVAIKSLKGNDNPWEIEIVDGVLKSLVHSFDTQGQFSDSLSATDMPFRDNPVVVYAPALILRKRSVKGLTDTLKRIKEHIKTGKDIPNEFRDLAEIPKMNDEHTNGDSWHSTSKFNGEVFFPKPSNEEQRDIVKKISSTNGVVVQGPPGTGKSHTIANLICHLLATGQRVLITAKTPRALRILEELVPKELRALCINLIDGGLGKGGSLETSVEGIHKEHDTWNQDKSRRECQKLETNLRHLRSEKAKIDHRLRDIRESETQPRCIAEGNYSGTAAEIAKAVNRNRNTYKWFTDDVTEDRTCPTGEDDLRKILKALRYFTPEKRKELELDFPDDLPSSTLWVNLVENEAKAIEEENIAEEGADNRVADLLSSRTSAYIESIRDTLSKFLDLHRNLMALAYSWMEEVIRVAIAGNTDSWRQILKATKHTLTTIEPLAEVADDTDISNPKEINLKLLHQASKALLLHLKNGGKLTWFCILPKSIVENRGLIKKILVNGRRPSTLQDFQDLEMALRVRLECEKAWGVWEGRAERPLGPYQLQMLDLKGLDDALEKALSLEELANKCREIIRQSPAIHEPVWFDEFQVETVVASCRFALARQQRRTCEHEIRKIENSIESLAKVHPLTHNLLDAIRERNTVNVTAIANNLQDLRDEQEHVQELDMHVSALRQHLPKLMDEFVRTCNDSYWGERVGKIENAWRWAYAKFWVEDFIAEENAPALARRAKQIEDEINAVVAQFAERRAWSFFFSRLTEVHRRHMEAWCLTMRQYGKGKGPRAAEKLQIAQNYLENFYETVPAWVMPLHRVWDTGVATPGMYDVVIVDEASQCGIEAMPLFYLGKKMLIVGDDKQISPEAVGLPRDVVNRLAEEFLYDYAFKSSFNVESSVFDHGKLRYGSQHITLREHFRCMPEIIRFSNDLCYSGTPLIPLRQYGPNRLVPIERVFVSGGYREGSGNRVINRPEADAVVEKIIELCNDSTGRYDDKTMGVVVLQGSEQARLIERQLLKRLGVEEMNRRKLVCGNPYSFQGDERDIMFLSLVAAKNERIGTFARVTDEQRFNVAASRAKDQMYLFHSVEREDLSDKCLRRRLLEFFENTTPQQIAGIDLATLEWQAREKNRHIVNPPAPFESWFELDVALEIARRGFNVIPQYKVATKRIDLVIEGGNARLAVECDGDAWHGPDEYEADMFRQRQLERCGWEFFRVRQSSFYLNRERALEGLWRALEERNIIPLREKALKAKSGQENPDQEKQLDNYSQRGQHQKEHNQQSHQPQMPASPPARSQGLKPKINQEIRRKSERSIQEMNRMAQQVRVLNQLEVNQESLKHLQRAGLIPQPGKMHLLELMEWRLFQVEPNNHPTQMEYRVWEALERELHSLMGNPNQKVSLEYLMKAVGDPEFPTPLEKELKQARSPEEAGDAVLSILREQMEDDPNIQLDA